MARTRKQVDWVVEVRETLDDIADVDYRPSQRQAVDEASRLATKLQGVLFVDVAKLTRWFAPGVLYLRTLASFISLQF